MQKIWLSSYPPGVPAEIDYSGNRSVGELFEKNAAKFQDRPAFYNMGTTITFGELDRRSRDFAAWLQGRGVGKGARVAVMMPNCLQYPIAAFGILRAGCVVVNVNPLYTSRELEHQLKDAGAEAIVVLENFCHVLGQVVARTPVRHVVVAALGDLLGAKGVLVNFVLRRVKKMVPAWRIEGALRFNAVLAEGARRELAKAATLTHRNILANLEQSFACIKPFLDESQPQIIITALPLYHILSLTANCLFMLKIGGCNILITNPRDIPAFVKELAKHRFTMFTGVNTLFNALLNNP